MNSVEKAGSFLPAPLLKWIAEGRVEERFPAVVAFADVSGFTAMSEKLTAIGKEGAEMLTGILNSYFTAMIDRIHRGGGFVGKFGGDAMTIFFPAENEEELPEIIKSAVAACCDLQIAMKPFHSIKNKAGEFSLGMKVGVSAGKVLFRAVKDKEGSSDYILAGKVLDTSAEAEHHGKSGEVIVSPDVIKYCSFSGDLLDHGFIRVDPSKVAAPEKDHSALIPEKSWNEFATAFIDPPIFHRMQLGMDSVGEIRKVSVIFLAFSGFDYDNDPQVGDKLDSLYGWVQQVTKSFNGSINKLDMGDKGSKILITFGTPIAHEDDERLAVRCGLELVSSQAAQEYWGGRVKAGIATGVVFAGEVGAPTRQEYTVMGNGVNLSARLMGQAKPGDLAIDDATFNRVEQLVNCNAPEFVTLKGIAHPIPIRSVLSLKNPSEVSATTYKPFIGRVEELGKIRQLITKAYNGAKVTVIIRGDAGTGKSRLMGEAIRDMNALGFKIGAGEALSYAKQSPYLSIISALRGLMDVPAASENYLPQSASENYLPQFEKLVRDADPEHPYRTPIIAQLLGIRATENEITQYFDAKLRQENMFDFLVQYVKFLSKFHPVALLFEDVQWIDRSSLELIAYLLQNLDDTPFMVAIVRRSYSRQFISPHIGLIEKAPNATTIDIGELEKEDLKGLILQELNADEIEPVLLDFINDKSQGNPAFTEELLKNLTTLGNLHLITSDGKRVATSSGDLSAVEVPDSLNSLIMSQLDRFGAEAKLTVKLASAIGRRFTRELVVGSYPVEMDESRIVETLKELSTLDVIKADDDELLQYIFKNLLTRDVAYDSLLFAHRREYHRRIGLCLEHIYADSIQEQCEELARHFYQSEDNKRAIQYLKIAGDKAFGLYANESAEDYFTKALEKTPEDDPANQFQLLSVRSKVLSIIGKTEAQKADLDKALQISINTNDPRGKVETLDSLALYYIKANNLDVLEQVINEANEILSKIEHPVARIGIFAKMGALKYAKNDFRGAIQHWEEGGAEAERLGDNVGLSVSLTNCGLGHKALGDLDKALELYTRSIAIDKESGNLKSEAVSLGNVGVLKFQRGEFVEAFDAFQRALDIGSGIGSKEIQARNLGNIAILYQQRGEREKALESQLLKLSFEQMMGYKRGQAVTLGDIGAWYSESGEFEQAIGYYEQALGIIRDLNLLTEEPRILMNLGLAKQYKGDVQGALLLLKSAVERSVEVKKKVAEEYARRYLGFVCFELDQFDDASKEFQLSGEVATAIGSKVGIAAVKVGLGLIRIVRGEGQELFLEGHEDVRALGDAENIIKGAILFAKWSLKSGNDKTQASKLLQDALELAKTGGRRRDILAIEPLLSQFQTQ